MTMIHHPADESLHRLVDGELPPPELAALERHLAGCERCRAVVDRLERLRRLVASAPRELEPPPEVWATLRARLPQVEREAAAPTAPPSVPAGVRGRRGLWSTAAALVLLAGAATVAARGWGEGGASPSTAAANGAPAPTTAAPAEDPLVAELRAELKARRRVITPETVAAVEASLREMDAAIAATQAALAADPDNVHLESMLERARRQQVEYVQGTLEIAGDL